MAWPHSLISAGQTTNDGNYSVACFHICMNIRTFPWRDAAKLASLTALTIAVLPSEPWYAHDR
jgi:hypothetical protein